MPASLSRPLGRPVPLHLIGASPGPRVVVTANVHGDEATGLGAVHLLVERLRGRLGAGELVLYPSLNRSGLVAGTRAFPADGQDLNRLFPGDPRGASSEREADLIWTDLLARRPAALLDLHADSAAAIPYALVDRACALGGAERARLEDRLRELAGFTGLTVLQEYPDEAYRSFQLDRSLTGALVNRAGLPAITLEIGPRRWMDPAAVEACADAVEGVLVGLGLVDGPAPPPHPTRLAGGPWRRMSGPRVSESGVLHPLIRPGGAFTAGQALAELRGLGGQALERIPAPRAGHVISLPERAWVNAGASVGTLAVRDA